MSYVKKIISNLTEDLEESPSAQPVKEKEVKTVDKLEVAE